MSTLPKINVELTLGDTILVGKNKQPAEITKIEYHANSGEVTLNTTKGPRKMLTFSLVEPDSSTDTLSRYR
jgi:hypothetical protein